MNNKVVIYKDENEFKKLVKSLKQYNMLAYKELVLRAIHKLKDGEILGEEIEPDIYKYYLPSDKGFNFVYGKTHLLYRIKGNKIVLLRLEPYNILRAGHAIQLPSYYGIPVSSPKDRFKIELYVQMYKKWQKMTINYRAFYVIIGYERRCRYGVRWRNYHNTT